MQNIKVIGIGGIGTSLVQYLARYLNFSDLKFTLILIDGDNFEMKNKERQIFDRLGNKAQVVAEMLTKQFPEMIIDSRDEYITLQSVEYLLQDGDIILMGVDNHKTRKIVSDYCKEFDNVLLISGGNTYTDGNIQVQLKKDGKDLTLPIANKYHEEISNPQDKSPDELGCDQLVASDPQLVLTNLFIASLMLNAFYLYTQKQIIPYDEVYGDVLTNSTLPVIRRKH